MACKESICRNCFHSYVCEQFNENKDDNNEKCHFYNDHYVPTSDVVPKSEVERLERLRAELSKEVSNLQDALKCEKETNKHLSDEYIALMKENEKLTINRNVYGLTAKRLAEEKAKVAREIFEELAIKSTYVFPTMLYTIAKRDVDKLKKKYTEVAE